MRSIPVSEPLEIHLLIKCIEGVIKYENNECHISVINNELFTLLKSTFLSLFQIPAAHLSGEIDVTEASHVYSQLYMREPGIRLLYVTPEKARFVHIHYLNQRCQLVRFMRKPYGFLRFARAYGRTMQSLQIFMIFAD